MDEIEDILSRANRKRESVPLYSRTSLISILSRIAREASCKTRLASIHRPLSRGTGNRSPNRRHHKGTNTSSSSHLRAHSSLPLFRTCGKCNSLSTIFVQFPDQIRTRSRLPRTCSGRWRSSCRILGRRSGRSKRCICSVSTGRGTWRFGLMSNPSTFSTELQGHAIKNKDLLTASGAITLKGPESFEELEEDVQAVSRVRANPSTHITHQSSHRSSHMPTSLKHRDKGIPTNPPFGVATPRSRKSHNLFLNLRIYSETCRIW